MGRRGTSSWDVLRRPRAVETAARIALRAVRDALVSHPGIARVRFVLFDRSTFEPYAAALQGLTEPEAP